MSFVVLCKWCGSVFRVLADDRTSTLVGQESEFWPDGYICPKCDAPGATGCDEKELPRFLQNPTIVDLTAQELYGALQGMGLPKDSSCLLADLQELFAAFGVIVHGADVPNTGRCALNYLEFPNGSRAYLGASSHGAVVYRILRPAVEKEG